MRVPTSPILGRDAVSIGVPFATVSLLGFDSGGFFPTAWGWAALGLLAACAILVLLAEEWPLERAELVAVGGLAALVLYMLVGVGWSHDVTETVLAAERAAVYPAALAAALLATRRGTVEDSLVGVLAASVLLSAAGLASKLLPGVLGAQNDANAHGQLYFPIGYWNGMGIMAGMGIVLAVGLALQRPAPSRWPWYAVAGLLAVTLVLTQSRGAALAVAAGILTCLALRGTLRRPSRRLLGGIAAVVGLVVVLSLTHTSSQPQGGATSLTGRSDWWSVALTEFEHHPVVGGGAGTWVAYWDRYRSEGHNIGNASSLYLEDLGELGLVGLGLLVAGLAPPIWMVRRFGAQGAAPAAAGAYVAFLVHAGLDWDWQLPAVTVAALWCGGAVLVAGRKRHSAARLGAGVRAGALAGCGVAAVAVTVGLVGNQYIARSAAELASGHYAAAASAARAASPWMPWSYRPAVWEGEAELAGHDGAGAASSFRTALGKPSGRHTWRLWWDLSRASEGPQQLHALGQVVKLNPRSPELRALCASPQTPGLAPLKAFCHRWRASRRAHRRF